MLHQVLLGPSQVYTTGLIVQELLQGFAGPRNRDRLLAHINALLSISPDRTDHIEAADIRNTCRRHGVQIGTVDALLIQLCRRHGLTLLSTDRDFQHAQPFVAFKLWTARQH